jgi:hypothetical protein
VKVDAYNTTDRPVVIDADGRTVGGREHATVDDRNDEITAAVDRGHLVLTKPSKKSTARSSSKRPSDTSAGTPADEPEES